MSNREPARKHDAKITPFTPIFDEVAEQMGMTGAAVYGAVWRHCQMREGQCRASQRRLSKLLNCHPSTVQRKLQMLIYFDYLIDTTPTLRNTPHTLRLGYEFTAQLGRASRDDEDE